MLPCHKSYFSYKKKRASGQYVEKYTGPETRWAGSDSYIYLWSPYHGPRTGLDAGGGFHSLGGEWGLWVNRQGGSAWDTCTHYWIGFYVSGTGKDWKAFQRKSCVN